MGYNACPRYRTVSNIIEYGTIVNGEFVKSTMAADLVRTNQRVTEQMFDSQGRVVKTIYPDGTFASSEFDAQGRVIAEIDPLGNRKDMTYNSSKRCVGGTY
jgi:YD repeat-containing protein